LSYDARSGERRWKGTKTKNVSGQMLTRREFLKAAGGGAVVLAAAGCGRPDILPNLPDRATIGGQDTNVVLVIIDTLRKDHLGAYGNPWIKTPNLDAFAQESLSFTQAYPESIPTICARRAIHTGIRTWPFRDWHLYKGISIVRYGWQPIPEEQTTLAEILQEKGYETLFVTDTQHQFQASMNFQRGFDVFDFIRGQTRDNYKPVWTLPREKRRAVLDKPAGVGGMRHYFANTAGRSSEEDWFAPRVFARASEFLEAASKGDRPFFLVVDSYDTHEPWDPPEDYVSFYDEGYNGREPYWPDEGSSSYLTDRQLQRVRALYAGEVTMMDHWLGNFLNKMSELGLFENTLLVVLADHGSSHGEHGIVGKPTYALWPEVTDIPFFIRHPEGKSAGKTSDYYASTHDVAPTILGFLGIEPPQPMEGQNLSVLLEGKEPEPRPHFTLGYHEHVWARDERYVMFSRYDGSEAKLYDVPDDPSMRNDLSGEHPDVVKRMFDGYVLKDAGGPLPTYDF
jgi:arylsulfatase A-like enzyme